jgi:hypothetical protein
MAIHTWALSVKEEDSTNIGLSRADARIDFPALRGAEAPLFHGAAHFPLVLREIKINVKGVGQECPTHTSDPRPGSR